MEVDSRNAVVPVQADDDDGVLVHRDGTHGARRIGRRGLQVIEKSAADGLTDTTISRQLRMDRSTFRGCRRRQPEVEEALVRGRAVLEDELCSLLLAKARKGDTIAILFALKARCGWREGEMPPGQVIVANQVQINMPARLTSEEFAELLASLSRAGPLTSATASSG